MQSRTRRIDNDVDPFHNNVSVPPRRAMTGVDRGHSLMQASAGVSGVFRGSPCARPPWPDRRERRREGRERGGRGRGGRSGLPPLVKS